MTACDEAQLRSEMIEACRTVRELTGAEAALFAYPNGTGGEREQAAVNAAGLTATFLIRSGIARGGDERYAMRTIEVSGHHDLQQVRRKIAFGANRVAHAGLARYYIQRIYDRLHG